MKAVYKMKKIICVLLAVIICLGTATVSFAGTGRNSDRIFDYEGLFSENDFNEADEDLREAEERCGFPLYFLSADSFEGRSAEDFADKYFYENGLGSGEDKDGALLLISIGERQVYIYTHGIAIRYITDSALDYIFDEYDGGIINALSEGDLEDAVEIFADSTAELCRQGIYENQFNIDLSSGKKDYYRKNSLSLFEIIFSVILAAAAAILPVRSIKKKYAMQTEKNMAERFNLSYRANAVYNFGNVSDTLIDKRVRSMPMPKVIYHNGSNGHGGSHGHFGGGGSSVSMGSGGSFHGGGGRSF